MRQLFAVAMVVAAMGAPACAQHGGGAGASGHSGFSARAGFSGASAGHFAGRAPMPRYGAGVRVGAPVARFARPDGANARAGFYRNGGERRRGAALGYGYYAPLDYGWLDANDSGYGAGYYDDGAGDGSVAADDGSGVSADGEQPQGYAPMVPYPQQPPVQYAERAPVEVAPVQAVTPAVEDADAVTLVFKDGRPAEKIRNYALTRTTLYVTDGRRREIPVAALDLTATEKANREAGVSFQLPGTR